jgi:hypothetical protein
MGKGPGSTWAVLTLLAAVALSPAQNLGLGTGSRYPSVSDSTSQNQTGQNNRGSDRQDDGGPRKSINKRLGLSARKNGPFDPKVFEARGRELTGQFYEIGGTATNVSKWSGTGQTEFSADKQKSGSRQWMIWAGAAGLAGASAAVATFMLMDNSHPTQAAPHYVDLSDGPAAP